MARRMTGQGGGRRRAPGRPLVGVAALAAAAAAALLGGGLREGVDPAPAAPPAAALGDPGLGLAAGDARAAVRRLERDAARAPGDARLRAQLGLAYLVRAQQLAAPSDYARAERALRASRALDRTQAEAHAGLAALALARHRFGEALRHGRRALALAPEVARYHGLVGDALLELGRYEAAFATFDRMVALRPSHGAYARVSYARELLGDLDGAEAAMRLALGPALGDAGATAWTHAHLGKLAFGRGRLDAAGRSFRRALAASPGDPAALEGLARVAAARGRLGEAVRLARRAAAAPVASHAATLGDLLAASGRRAAARRWYARAAEIDRRERRFGVALDLDTAGFLADRGLEPARAVALARSGRALRPSVVGDDVLAWALARAGRCAEARGWSIRALRLGTRDAAMFFHRGAIEQCLGDPAEARRWYARALALNPHFSPLLAPVARRALRSA